MKANLPYQEQFDLNHRDRGGLKMLITLYQEGKSNPEIAQHFGMTEQGISYTLKKILGSEYMAWPWRKAKADLPKPDTQNWDCLEQPFLLTLAFF